MIHGSIITSGAGCMGANLGMTCTASAQRAAALAACTDSAHATPSAFDAFSENAPAVLTSPARSLSTSIVSKAFDAHACAQTHHAMPHVSEGNLIAILLVGALGMAAKGGGFMNKVRGLFGGGKKTAEPDGDIPRPPRAAGNAQHSKAAETLAAAINIPVAARPSHPAPTDTTTVDPYGALLGTTLIVKLSLAFAGLIDKLDIHQAIGISQSVVRAVAMNPACIVENEIPAWIVREAMAQHDAFSATEITVVLPTIDAALAGLLRRVYNDLYNRIEKESQFGIEPGEEPKLRKARISAMAEYYLHHKINQLMTLFQMRIEDFTDAVLRVDVKGVALDLNYIRTKFEKKYPSQAAPSIGVEQIGGRTVSPEKLARLLGIEVMRAHNFLRANRNTVTAYVQEWERLSFGSQLCYLGGFEEFLAEDMLPGGTNKAGLEVPPSIEHGRKNEHRQLLLEEAIRNAASPKLAAIELKRTMRIQGRLIAIPLLARELSFSLTGTVSLLSDYEAQLEQMYIPWNDPQVRDADGYERVIAKAIRDLVGRKAVAVEAQPKRQPSSTPPGGRNRGRHHALMGVKVFDELPPDALEDDFDELPSDLLEDDED